MYLQQKIIDSIKGDPILKRKIQLKIFSGKIYFQTAENLQHTTFSMNGKNYVVDSSSSFERESIFDKDVKVKVFKIKLKPA